MCVCVCVCVCVNEFLHLVLLFAAHVDKTHTGRIGAGTWRLRFADARPADERPADAVAAVHPQQQLAVRNVHQTHHRWAAAASHTDAHASATICVRLDRYGRVILTIPDHNARSLSANVINFDLSSVALKITDWFKVVLIVFLLFPDWNRSSGGLLLEGNHWTCSCDNGWLGNWLKRWYLETFTIRHPVSTTLASSATCQDPVTGRKRPIIDLTPNDNSCSVAALSAGSSSSFRLVRFQLSLPLILLILVTLCTWNDNQLFLFLF